MAWAGDENATFDCHVCGETVLASELQPCLTVRLAAGSTRIAARDRSLIPVCDVRAVVVVARTAVPERRL